MNLVISGHEDRCIRYFDLITGKQVHQSVGHTDAVTGISIHPNGK
jgi:WD40 repeat protein